MASFEISDLVYELNRLHRQPISEVRETMKRYRGVRYAEHHHLEDRLGFITAESNGHVTVHVINQRHRLEEFKIC